ncbi:MAG: TetR/AcrR family transcriptional regulator [Thermoleophilaceae bacterium]|nr:TetR/AcrR family transcriptional regulator [Thermoleophilaceae bacterium]
MAGRRSAAEARDTRAKILRRAADVASADGLEGLTIGRLASELDMSKAGVIGQFGSKEELQLATLALAAEIFRGRVWEPVEHLPAGLPRLLAVCESWTRYAKKPPFPGGCFIAAASFEFDGRSGRVHDELAKVVKRWRKTLAAEVETAVRAGELGADTDPDQVAFSLEALAAGANPARQLHGDTSAASWSLRAMHAVLGVPAPKAA